MTKEKFLIPLFEEIGNKGWRKSSLIDLAKSTNLPLADFYALFPTKIDILKEFGRIIDAQLLAQLENQLSDNPHDALFDILMTRFELMEPYKSGILAIYNDTIGHVTKDLPAILPNIMQSLSWMGNLTPQGENILLKKFPMLKLSYVYFQTLRTWLWDDSPDSNLTMVEIDERLKEIESWPQLPRFLNVFSKIFSKSSN